MGKEFDVVAKLIEEKYTIAFAESCTGGLAAGRLIDVPDASKVLASSIVTYADEAKIRYCHVRPETIAEHGVVSCEVAKEMAAGIADECRADVGVGVTGYAGPGGGSPDCPVGTVCFGFCVRGRIVTAEMRFGDIGRNAVRAQSVEFIFDKLAELLG